MCEIQYICKYPFFGEKGFVLIFLHCLNEGNLKIGSNCIESCFWWVNLVGRFLGMGLNFRKIGLTSKFTAIWLSPNWLTMRLFLQIYSLFNSFSEFTAYLALSPSLLLGVYYIVFSPDKAITNKLFKNQPNKENI